MAFEDYAGQGHVAANVTATNPTKASDHNALVKTAAFQRNVKSAILPGSASFAGSPRPPSVAGTSESGAEWEFWFFADYGVDVTSTVVAYASYEDAVSNNFLAQGFSRRWLTVECLFADVQADTENWSDHQIWPGGDDIDQATTTGEYLPKQSVFLDTGSETLTFLVGDIATVVFSINGSGNLVATFNPSVPPATDEGKLASAWRVKIGPRWPSVA